MPTLDESGVQLEGAAQPAVSAKLVETLIAEVKRLQAQVERSAALAASAALEPVEDFKLSSVLDPIPAEDRLKVVRALGALKAAAPAEVSAATSRVEGVAPGLLAGCARNSQRRGKSLGHSIGAAINYLTARGI